jgi:hypothetical protein
MKKTPTFTAILLAAAAIGSAQPGPIGPGGVPYINQGPLAGTRAQWVEGKDRIRVKTFSVSSTLRYALRIRFLRVAEARTGNAVTVTKILSPNNSRGTGLPPYSGGGSFAFGPEGGWGRTVSDAAITNGDNTLTSENANFTSGDVGKQITIAGACVAGYQGVNCPTSLYHGQIATYTAENSVEVYPAATATVSNAALVIEPTLLADEDGVELGDGWILGVDANYWSGNDDEFRRGQLYIECELNRVAYNYHEGIPLFQGYLGASEHLGWPYGVNERKVSGHGGIKVYTVSNPSAGADWTYTIPSNARFKVISVKAVLTTSSSVADRRASLVFDDGTNISWYSLSNQLQAASATNVYQVSPGMVNSTLTTAAGTVYQSLSMAPVQLSEDFRIRSSTINIQAADQWSAIVVTVEEWIEE